MPDQKDPLGILGDSTKQQKDPLGILTGDPVKKKEIGGLVGGLIGTGGDGRSVSSGLVSGTIKKVKPVKKVEISGIEDYNKNFRETTGIKAEEFDLGSDLPQIKKAREEKKYLQYRDIEENKLKPVVSAVRTGTASPKQLQELYSQPYGRKIVSDVIKSELPELADIGGLDPEIINSGEKWQEISKRLQEKNRPAGVEAQNQSEFALDNELDNTFRNFTYGKEELIEGARKGDPRELKETKIPFGAINTTSPTDLMAVLDRIGNMPYVFDASGNRKSTKELKEKIQERIFQLKSTEQINPEITGNKEMILDAVSKVPVEWKRKIGDNPDLTNKDAEYIMQGLNYIKDLQPGRYGIIMATLEKTGKISEQDFTELASMGRTMQYFKDFKEGKYVEPDERSLITPQIKQAELSGWLSERLKQMGKTKRAAVPQKDILEAYQDAPEELKDEELLRNIINKERAPSFGFLPIAQGEGITKTGGLPTFMRGVASPFKSVVNSAETTFDSPFESYLKSKELNRGNQLIPQKRGGYGDILPSEKFWNKASEGFGSFLSQLFLARGFGNVAKIPVNQAIGRVYPMGAMTSGEAALKLGTPLSTLAQTYGGEYVDFLEKTGSPTKAGFGAFVSGLTQGIIEKNIMPDVLIAEKASLLLARRNFAKEVIDVVEKGGGKAGVADVVKKFVANTTKMIGKEAWLEENLQNLTNYLTEAVISPKTVQDRNLIKETVDTGNAATVMMLIPSLLGGAGETKIKRSLTKAQLNAIAADPQQYIQSIDNQFSLGQISKDEHELATKIISTQRDNINNSPRRDANGELISAERQLEYAYQSTVQQIAQEQAAKITDPIQREPLEKKAEEADKIKRQIFYGEEGKELPPKEGEPVTIDQDGDLMDEEPELTSAEMKAVKIAALEPLPGMYQEMLDSNPTAVIKEIADQAQGVTEDGKPLEGGSRKQDLLNAGVSQKFIDAAIEAYPAPSQSVSVQMPQTTEIKPAETTQPGTAATSKKGVIKKARGIEDLTDPRDIVLQYFAGGNRINSSAIQELFGGGDDRIHFGKKTGGEQKAKISLIKKDAPSIKDLAHQLWEQSGGLEEGYQYTDRDFRDAIEAVLQEHNSPTSMSVELVDKYINKAVKQELTENEAKEISDIEIAQLTKYVNELPENQQEQLVEIIKKYQDKFGFVDWEQLEKDSNGFDPEILSLPIETQNALDGIIQKNIQSGQGELSNTTRQNSRQEEVQEEIIPQEPPGETLAEQPPIPPAKQLAGKIRGLKIDLSKLSGGGLQSNPLGLPVAIWNGAMDIVAAVVEQGGNVADAVKRGLNYIQKNHRGQWDKKRFNDEVLKELGVRGITVNGEDLIVKNDTQTQREYAKTVNGWYSDLEQSILDIKGSEGTAAEWAKKLGQSEEAKWTGLNDWLAQQTGKVTKKAVLQYLKDNRVEIVEVVKDSTKDKIDLSKIQFNDVDENSELAGDFDYVSEDGKYRVSKYSDGTMVLFDDNDVSISKINSLSEVVEFDQDSTMPKFSEYQLEGQKENYKEVLVTLPEYDKSKTIYQALDKNGKPYGVGAYDKASAESAANRIGGTVIERKEKSEKQAKFLSTHFDEPNILVHLRMNTRTDADGNKVLFLEEIQSDWGQKGKKEGFAAEKDKTIYNFAKSIYNIRKRAANGSITSEEANRLLKSEKVLSESQGVTEEELYKAFDKYGDFTKSFEQAVQPAPFVTETPSWTKLGLKVALKEAVKQGADKIAWTTGEQQADRYSLAEQVNSISVTPNEKGKYVFIDMKGSYDVTLSVDENGKILEDKNNLQGQQTFIGKSLDDVVGKDMAQKILSETKENKYEGEGLKVGGTGMKGFYGSPTEGSLGIVGNVAKSLFKQEPKTVEIESGRKDYLYTIINKTTGNSVGGGFTLKKANDFIESREAGNYEMVLESAPTSTQHSIDITPELKAEVEGGLPLFKDIKGRGKELADLLRKGKIKAGGLQSNIAGIPIALWNAAIDTIAFAIESGATLAQAVQKAIRDHKLNQQPNFNQKEFISKLEAATGETFIEEPIQPPTEPVKEDSGEGSGKKKSTLNRLYEAKNMPERARAAFEKEGLEYVPASQEEAAAVAKATVDELGIDEAINLAAAGTFDGGVNAMIFGEVLNRLADNESDAGKWAEVAIQWDKYNRVRGQDISAINFFYKNSPLGVVLKENADRKKQFDEWAKGKNQSWEDYFEELKKNPEFAKILDKKIQEDLRKERQSSRAKRLASVRGAFAKAKEKFRKEGGGTYATIIPPHVIETVLEAMELAYEAGEAVVKIVDDAIKSISQKIGTDNWDKEKFRKEWESELSEKGGKAPLTDEELKAKVLDKFRKKLKGLTEKEKDEVIRKAYKKIIESGGLDYDEFKEIIARVTGRGELTEEQKKQLKEMVAKTNAAGEAAKVAQEERTPESLQKFYAAEIEAGRAARDLRDIFRQKPDIIRRLTSIMQLSTLGAVSLVANVTYNIWNQLALRYPIGLINDTIDRIWGGIGRMMGKPSVQEYNVWEAQGAFWNKMGQGVKESFEQIGSGLNRQDYTQKELYGQQMRPFKAWRELMAYAKGKRQLTRAEWWDKLIEGTAGIPAELVARFLNVGDKPLRFGAQGAQAKAFTKALGLKGIDEKLFIEFPKEEAYRYYKGQGLSDEAAQQKADYVAEAIRKEGERATLQQDNLLNDAITRAAGVLPGGKDSGLASAAKMFVISPYIKIPTNAFWSYYNLVNPEVAIMQSLTYAGLAKKSKNKGDITKSQLLNREARYWMAHAMLGMGLRAVVIAMVQAGIVTPPPDDEESKKERDAMAFFDKPGTIQIGDTKIQTKWFGQLGALSNSIARKYFDATPEQRQNQDEFWNVVLGGMELEALKELENGIFANSSSLFQSISSGDFSRYGINTINLLANIVQPATIAQLNRAALDEVPTSKGDSFLDKLNQNFAQRSTLYRRLFDVDIYKKQDIFGRPIPKGGNLLSRMFGVSKANPQLEMRLLYDDYLRTGDSGFLPSATPTKIGDTKLTMQQQQKLAEYVGEERLRKLRPYISGAAKIPIIEKPYSDLTDEKKKEVVQSIYESGRLKGLEKFYKDYPEFKKAELSPEQQVEKKLLDVGKKLINQ